MRSEYRVGKKNVVPIFPNPAEDPKKSLKYVEKLIQFCMRQLISN
jgi:hypothetical protein